MAPTLHLMCGKIAAGKSTLSAALCRDPGTVLIAEDAWINTLYAGELTTISDYMRCMSKFRAAMGPHVVGLLGAKVSVVLDFQANTVEARKWARGILDQTTAEHELHYLDVPDEVCLARLRNRNAQGDHPFAPTEAEFRQVAKYFVPPSPDEGFNVVHHRHDASK